MLRENLAGSAHRSAPDVRFTSESGESKPSRVFELHFEDERVRWIQMHERRGESRRYHRRRRGSANGATRETRFGMLTIQQSPPRSNKVKESNGEKVGCVHGRRRERTRGRAKTYNIFAIQDAEHLVLK